MDILKQKTLLYAEDELITQAIYSQFFNHYFRCVYTADNGQQAWDIFKEKQPDVLVLDINMPQINGLELSRKIRKQDNKTNIILLTSRNDKKALIEAIELGLTCYLEKPVSKEKLLQAFKKLLVTEKNKEKYIHLWSTDNQVFTWNTLSRELLCNKEEIHLTKNEKILLELLINVEEEKVSCQKIHQRVWATIYSKEYSVASIKTLISALRIKLPPKVIKNVYGLGYYLDRGNTLHQ